MNCNLLFVVMLIVMSGGMGTATAQSEVDHKAVEQMYEKFAAVGPHHAIFKDMAGTWNTESKSYHENPEAPQTSTGVATFEVLMGGRYLRQHFKGEFGGKPFEGIGITGFDNAKQKYVGTWIDNMGTGIMTSEGEWDAASKIMKEVASMSSPMGEMKMNMVTEHINKDKFNLTMTMLLPTGEETKAMEVVYTRK